MQKGDFKAILNHIKDEIKTTQYKVAVQSNIKFDFNVFQTRKSKWGFMKNNRKDVNYAR